MVHCKQNLCHKRETIMPTNLTKRIKRSLKQAWKNTQPDPHYQAMEKNYKQVPLWWYIVVLLVGFFLGLGAVAQGQTTLDLWAYVVAIVSLPSNPNSLARQLNIYSSWDASSPHFRSVYTVSSALVSQRITCPRC